MTWALLLALIAIVIIMAMHSRGQVPWGDKMRRIHAGVARKAEWMAPDDVVDCVREDYLSAVRWLGDNMLTSWPHQWAGSLNYLSGPYLKRFRMGTPPLSGGHPRAVGVLRADHQVTVRCFSEDGECCLVIDRQSQRRMATYDARTRERIMTQDLGDGAVVYQMRYDVETGRWKIHDFIQELPLGWGAQRRQGRIREMTALPSTLGRDN
jgi:hypothetical protein